MNETPTILFAGQHLRMMHKGKWEYAERPNASGVVGIVAVTDDGKLLLIEQYRAPVDKRVIELPAGLVGDEPGQKKEGIIEAARRELLEETGYEAGEITILAAGPSSAGMSSEVITLVMARKLRKLGAGGGVGGESIVLHEILVSDVERRLKEWGAEGKLMDLKIFAALHFVGEG